MNFEDRFKRMPKKEQQHILKIVEENLDGVGNAGVFVIPWFRPPRKGDPGAWIAMLQYGAALMLEKPIYILAPKGTHIPAKLVAAADGVEYFEEGNDESMKAATKRLLKKYTDRPQSRTE